MYWNLSDKILVLTIKILNIMEMSVNNMQDFVTKIERLDRFCIIKILDLWPSHP